MSESFDELVEQKRFGDAFVELQKAASPEAQEARWIQMMEDALAKGMVKARLKGRTDVEVNITSGRPVSGEAAVPFGVLAPDEWEIIAKKVARKHGLSVTLEHVVHENEAYVCFTKV